MRQIIIKDVFAKTLIDFDKYTKDDEGYISFLKDVEDLFKSKQQSDKDAIFKAGGYKNIFRLSDEYFQEEGDTVNIVTGRFLALAGLKDAESLKVKDDDSGYRFTVLERFNPRYGFRFPSEFYFARELVVANWELSTSALKKTGN